MSTNTAGHMLVHPDQEHNPVLKLIRNVPWVYAEQAQGLTVDFQPGRTTGVLFLSARYHRLHPNYIYERLRSAGSDRYRLQLLLFLADVENWERTARELTRACMALNWTLLAAWSPEEAARHLELLKAYEHRTAEALRDRQAAGPSPIDCLVEIRSVNRSDAAALLGASSDGTLAGIADLTGEQLLGISGFGRKKAERLMASLDAPFYIPE